MLAPDRLGEGVLGDRMLGCRMGPRGLNGSTDAKVRLLVGGSPNPARVATRKPRHCHLHSPNLHLQLQLPKFPYRIHIFTHRHTYRQPKLFAVEMSDILQDGKRPHPEDAAEPAAKRQRELSPSKDGSATPGVATDVPPAVSRLGLRPQLPELPASLEIATGVKADLSSQKGFVGEPEVGIVAYLGNASYTGIRGVIKQR